MSTRSNVYRMLLLRNPCVAIVVMCLCLSASRGIEEGVDRNKRFIHPEDRRPDDIAPRIIGGEDVPLFAYPFQVGLMIPKDDASTICGGSLISPNTVLTAAHCLHHGPMSVVVYLGTQHLFLKIPGISVVMKSSDYVVHWWWDVDMLQSDIALVRLPRDVTYSQYIQPIKLATGTDTFEGETATIIGWGTTEMGPPNQYEILKRVNTTVMSNDDCEFATLENRKVIAPSHICTFGTGPVGSCFGDSGGPLVVNGVQVGIVSFGRGNCQTGAPSVFTRVSAFSDWIARGRANTLSGQFGVVGFIVFFILFQLIRTDVLAVQ